MASACSGWPPVVDRVALSAPPPESPSRRGLDRWGSGRLG
jgi:hypothetical protein